MLLVFSGKQTNKHTNSFFISQAKKNIVIFGRFFFRPEKILRMGKERRKGKKLI